MNVLQPISREDLLLRVKRLLAENSLLKNQLSELTIKHSANEAYIKEIEPRLKAREKNKSDFDEVHARMEKYQQKIRNQKELINSLHKKLKH